MFLPRHGTVFDAQAAEVGRKLRSCDPVEPGQVGSLDGPVFEAPLGSDRGGLCRKFDGYLGVEGPLVEVRQDARSCPLVEFPERGGIVSGSYG